MAIQSTTIVMELLMMLTVIAGSVSQEKCRKRSVVLVKQESVGQEQKLVLVVQMVSGQSTVPVL